VEVIHGLVQGGGWPTPSLFIAACAGLIITKRSGCTLEAVIKRGNKVNTIKQTISGACLSYEVIEPFLNKFLQSLNADSRLIQLVHKHAQSLLEEREYADGELMGRVSSCIVGYMKGRPTGTMDTMKSDHEINDSGRYLEEIAEIIATVPLALGTDSRFIELTLDHARELRKKGKYGQDKLRERVDSFVLGYVESQCGS
jgi:hypothetical protein